MNKASFSCCGDERFTAELNALGKEQILLCGIETHVCIYQTAMDLMEGGLDITVIADAVSSRTEQNRQIALTRLAAEGPTSAARKWPCSSCCGPPNTRNSSRSPGLSINAGLPQDSDYSCTISRDRPPIPTDHRLDWLRS